MFITENIKQELEKKPENTLVFCLDNSGSMGEMVKLKDPQLIQHLKNHKERMLESQLKELESMKEILDAQDYQEQKQNIIYFNKKNPSQLSRKQCVEIALESQLDSYVN